MFCTQGLFSDRQRAFEEPLRLRVFGLGYINEGQVVESLAHEGMTRTERFFADDQRALVQPLRLAVLALPPIHDGQFVERNGVIWMIGTEARLHHPLKLLCLGLGGGVVSARVMILKCLVDGLDVGRLGRCGREERREYKDRDKSDRLAAPSRYHDLIFDVVPARTHNSRRKYGEKFPVAQRLKNSHRFSSLAMRRKRAQPLFLPTLARPSKR